MPQRQILGEWIPARNNTIAAAAITQTFANPGPDLAHATRNVHIEVPAGDGGTGNITITIDLGNSIIKTWVLEHDATLGTTFDYAAELVAAENQAMVITVARAGLTTGQIDWLKGLYQ